MLFVKIINMDMINSKQTLFFCVNRDPGKYRTISTVIKCSKTRAFSPWKLFYIVTNIILEYEISHFLWLFTVKTDKIHIPKLCRGLYMPEIEDACHEQVIRLNVSHVCSFFNMHLWLRAYKRLLQGKTVLTALLFVWAKLSCFTGLKRVHIFWKMATN